MTDSTRSVWAVSFGLDPAGYDQGRPPYPDFIYERLEERCGLGPGTRGFEIGPGTGIATRALLERGLSSLTAIEPDTRLAAFLAENTPGAGDRLQVVATTFADADLPEAAFDLGVAATTLHWLDPLPTLRKVVRLLRPGGTWAMWWTIYGDAIGTDDFHEATRHLFPPQETGKRRSDASNSFALDSTARLAEFSASGLVDGSYELMRWSLPFDAARTRGLYATFPHIRTQPPAERDHLLDQLGRVVDESFGGVVHRTLLTPLYIARRP